MSIAEQAMEIISYVITNIAPMYARERSRAYKYFHVGPEDSDLSNNIPSPDLDLSTLPEKEQYLFKSRTDRFKADLNRATDSDFPLIFGALQPWDTYYLSLCYDSNYAFHYYTASVTREYHSYIFAPLNGRKFLQNLIHVKTFITNAKYDLVVFTNALPLSFRNHTDIVEESSHLKNSPLQADRPGLIKILYKNGAFGLIENIGVRTIRFPLYTQSSHPVSLTEPEEFYDDVAEWLKE